MLDLEQVGSRRSDLLYSCDEVSGDRVEGIAKAKGAAYVVTPS